MKLNEGKPKPDHVMLEEMRAKVDLLLNTGAKEVKVEITRYSYVPMVGAEERPNLSITITSEQRINNDYQ